MKAPPRSEVMLCPYCGLMQHVPHAHRHEVSHCSRCRSQLEHCAGTHLDSTLAVLVAWLLLLPGVFLLPFLSTTAGGITLTSHLTSSFGALWTDGQPLLAVAFLLFVLILPAVTVACQTLVLGLLYLGQRRPWLGPLFRVANELSNWAMLDVMLLGLVIAYLRLRSTLEVEVGTGALCFIAAVMLQLVARATLDRAAVWRQIAPDTELRCGEPAVECPACHLVVDVAAESQRCPRCTARVIRRRPHSYAGAAALLIAAGLLYVPANLYPIATIPINLKPTAYTVFGGAVELGHSHLYALALLVLAASFLIPLLKLSGLCWCFVSALRGSTRHLIGKTRTYRVMEEVGRWSMVDPFTIACFIPVVQFNSLLTAHAEPAATPFAAVVLLTIWAVRLFDPRLMWDQAGLNA